MIFLIEYDRSKGSIVIMDRFNDSDRTKAEKKRLELEINLNRKKVGHEIVLLEAAEENLLRHTHRRYFDTLRTIATSTAGTTSIVAQIN
jgi:hypothetical protein